MNLQTSKSIHYIGVHDLTLDLFENQFPTPNGISYNSYLIEDEKTTVMDSVDARTAEPWLENLAAKLNGKKPDYLVISHMEPDHAGSVVSFINRYPDTQIVCNAKTVAMMGQFFADEITPQFHIVKEGETLPLGTHSLQFFMAPMVHWPEVMVSHEQTEKILFSADAFGTFGACESSDKWIDEARRYYFNICGKYGQPIQSLLKKLTQLDIKTICSLHGPILSNNLSRYIDLYNLWSSYQPESQGVFVVYASIYGHTAKAALQLADKLKDKQITTIVCDLCRCDMSQAVSNAFKYSHIVVAASSYDAGIFPPMENFLNHLKSKSYQNRTVGIIENGSWAPVAGKQMRSMFESMKNITICEPMVTIKSNLNKESQEALNTLAIQIFNV